MRVARLLGCSVAALLLASCSFFKRTANVYYTLEPLSGATKTLTGAPIAIEGIELPPGIDRRELVARKADHTLDVRPNQLWSAPLRAMVIHTLAFDLAKRLPEGMVVLPGQAKPPAARTVFIIFEDLAQGPNGEFVLDARWGRNHERITIPGGADSPAIVVSMNQALASLADRIAAAM